MRLIDAVGERNAQHDAPIVLIAPSAWWLPARATHRRQPRLPRARRLPIGTSLDLVRLAFARPGDRSRPLRVSRNLRREPPRDDDRRQQRGGLSHGGSRDPQPGFLDPSSLPTRKLDRDHWLRGMRRLRDKTGEGQGRSR